jgi:hypothetical protein
MYYLQGRKPKDLEHAMARFQEVLDNDISFIDDGGWGSPPPADHLPWRPTNDPEHFTTHDPDGSVVAIQQHFAEWEDAIGPGHDTDSQRDELDSHAFATLAEEIKEAVRNRVAGAVNYDGFISHEHQYMDDNDIPGNTFPCPFRPWIGDHSYLSQDALDALDAFLSTEIDPLVAEGKVRYATMSEIYEAYLVWEQDPANTCGDGECAHYETTETCTRDCPGNSLP